MKFIPPAQIRGSVRAPSSKSVAQRAILASTLSAETSHISNLTLCDDTRAAVNVAEALGAEVSLNGDEVHIRGRQHASRNSASCGESGFCLRCAAPIAALLESEFTLYAEGTLRTRPMQMVVDALNLFGVKASAINGLPPLTVHGPLCGGTAHIDGSITSQLITGLLLALPCCEHSSELIIDHIVSKPYVALTIDMARSFGVQINHSAGFDSFKIPGNQKYRGASIAVEGDWSAAAPLLVAAAIAGELELTGLSQSSIQADKQIVSALAQAGAEVSVTPYSVQVRKKVLRPIDFDATDCPDIFPPLIALAAATEGTSSILGAKRLEAKESNRAKTLVNEFSRLGTHIEQIDNTIRVTGASLVGGDLDSHQDHRIAMAGAVAGLVTRNGVHIKHPEAVRKSYPLFFETLESLLVMK